MMVERFRLGVVALAVVVSAALGCRPAAPPAVEGSTTAALPVTIRLIDITTPDDVVTSPLRDSRASIPDHGGAVGGSSWRCTPLDEPGVGDDPLGMKQRLSIEGASYAVLLAPAHTELRTTIELPETARLRFGYGVVPRDRSSEMASTSFEVWLGDGHDEIRIHRRVVDLHSAGPPPLTETVTLDGAMGSVVTLRLVTTSDAEGATDPLAYWADPVVYGSLAPRAPSSDPGSHPPRPINVVLLSVDALSARHLGLYGYPRDTDPQLWALATDATTYLSARSQYPSTAISHMSMFTSRAPHRSARALDIGFDVGRADGAAPQEETVAAILRQAGWTTCAITGGGAMHPGSGFDHGFDSFLGRDEEARPESLHRAAADWMAENADRAFFLFLRTSQVHGPYTPPEPFAQAFNRGDGPPPTMDPMSHLHAGESCAHLDPAIGEAMVDLYDGEIAYTDDRLIGPLAQTLQELGLSEDTMLIVTSDHGEEFGEHGCWTHGANLFDSTMHVPLVIRYPGSHRRGETVVEPVGLLDIAPTIVAVAGLPADPWAFEGQDLAQVPHRRVSHAPVAAVDVVSGSRLATVDLGEQGHGVRVAQYFLVEGDHKLIVTEPIDPVAPDTGGRAARAALYDLVSDPHEQRDVCAARQRLCDAMLARARARLE